MAGGHRVGDHTESGGLRVASPRGDVKDEAEVARRREWGECPGQRGGCTGGKALTVGQVEVGKVSCRSGYHWPVYPRQFQPLQLSWPGS